MEVDETLQEPEGAMEEPSQGPAVAIDVATAVGLNALASSSALAVSALPKVLIESKEGSVIAIEKRLCRDLPVDQTKLLPLLSTFSSMFTDIKDIKFAQVGIDKCNI
jgi:hypothetical protein